MRLNHRARRVFTVFICSSALLALGCSGDDQEEEDPYADPSDTGEPADPYDDPYEGGDDYGTDYGTEGTDPYGAGATAGTPGNLGTEATPLPGEPINTAGTDALPLENPALAGTNVPMNTEPVNPAPPPEPLEPAPAAPGGGNIPAWKPGGRVMYVTGMAQTYSQPGGGTPVRTLTRGDHPLVWSEGGWYQTSEGNYVEPTALSDAPIGRGNDMPTPWGMGGYEPYGPEMMTGGDAGFGAPPAALPPAMGTETAPPPVSDVGAAANIGYGAY